MFGILRPPLAAFETDFYSHTMQPMPSANPLNPPATVPATAPHHFRRGCSLLLAVFFGFLIGCADPEPITSYTVPTQVPQELLPGNERILGAIVPLGTKAWFFKVRGPEDATGEVEEAFRSFVKEITFDRGEPDLSQLPSNWRRGADKPMRFASIDVSTSSKQLDVSVSSLPRQSDWDRYVSDNINRWRGQLGADPSSDKWAGAEPMEVGASDGPAVWFDLVGKPSQGSPGSPPMMSSMIPDNHPPMTSDAPPPRKQKSLDFDRPEGWRDGRRSSMRLASFSAGPEDAAADISVMPAGGDLRGNVARWLGQVRSGNAPDDVVDKALADAEKRTVADREAQRYILTGEDAETGNIIDATIVPLDERTSMFIKMIGPAETVSEQSDAMSEFLDSLQF